MKTTKTILYGLLLAAGLASCSKEYNSDPVANANAFGGSNPVAPITGAGPNEIVFKENGTTVRLTEAKYMENGPIRTIVGISTPSGGKAFTYTFILAPFSGLGTYNGTGKPNDTLVISKTIFDVANPTTDLIRYFTGGFNKDLSGYCYTKITDTTGMKLKGEFAGRLVRRDPLNPDKDFGEFVDVTSGFYNASKFEP